MEIAVEKYLENKNLLKSNNVFIIAFSGGYDSMCLANIMIDLSKKYQFKIVLAHLNHNWRGAKADAEEMNCEKFAKQHNVEFYTEKLDSNLPHTETVAREERYKFFVRAAEKYATNIILTAHTKSDNIETVLQRIIKGTGIGGLKGISDERNLGESIVYRPLLDFSRNDILSYCKIHDLSPNNDDSNKDVKYFRNKIREQLIPDLKNHYDENIENALWRLIQNANDEENIIEELLQEKYKRLFADRTIKTSEFVKLNLALKKRIIKNLLENNGFDYTQKRICEIVDFIIATAKSKTGKTFSITENKWIYTNTENIFILDAGDYNKTFAQTEVNLDGETYLEEFDAVIRISKWNEKIPEKFPTETENVVYADLSNVEMPLVLRPRLFGDRIVPFGQHSPIKLKKYLNNKKLSKQEKSKVLLISSPKEVIWVINWGISNNIRVKNMPTHKIEFYKRSKNG